MCVAGASPTETYDGAYFCMLRELQREE